MNNKANKTSFKKGSIPYNKGKKCPEISERQKGNKGYWFGKKQPKEMSEKRIKTRKNNREPWCSEETRKRLMESSKGEGNPNWKGGMQQRKRPRNTFKYAQWRMKVFLRDNFTCIICNKVGEKLNAHHLKFWIKHPKLRYKVDNGITVCIKCHHLIHNKNGK